VKYDDSYEIPDKNWYLILWDLLFHVTVPSFSILVLRQKKLKEKPKEPVVVQVEQELRIPDLVNLI
jgi:hypothetical protein